MNSHYSMIRLAWQSAWAVLRFSNKWPHHLAQWFTTCPFGSAVGYLHTFTMRSGIQGSLPLWHYCLQGKRNTENGWAIQWVLKLFLVSCTGDELTFHWPKQVTQLEVNRARICYSTDRNSEQNNQWWVGRSIYQRAGNYQNRCRKYFQPFNFPKLVITIKLWPNLLKGNNSLSHHNSSPETHRM